MILDDLNILTRHHMEQCAPYRYFVESLFKEAMAGKLGDVPFLPVRAFKEFSLKSVSEDEVYKVLRSSGTSGQQSEIFLDRDTAQKQTRALVEIFGGYFGSGRFPMLVIDSESTVRDRFRFSARTAGINGFSMFSRGRCFALNDDLSLDIERVESFLEAYSDKRIFVFGFTYLIWSAFVQQLKRKNRKLALENAFFLHGGGWKKLEAEKVTNKQFRQEIYKVTGCSAVHNYYGMVEQTGSIFIECERGHLHASDYSDVIVRSPDTHQVLEHGQTGLIQLFSSIQRSYPGHSILTEDVGRSFPGTHCSCGRTGTIVEIDGRLAQAEVRGCSDAYS